MAEDNRVTLDAINYAHYNLPATKKLCRQKGLYLSHVVKGPPIQNDARPGSRSTAT